MLEQSRYTYTTAGMDKFQFLNSRSSLGWLVCLTFVLTLKTCDAVACYTCTNVSNATMCTTPKTCPSSQICYTDVKGYWGHWTYTMGCKLKTACDGTGTSALVGKRAVADSTCSKCCNTTYCNRQQCTAETELCYDDPTINCKTTDNLFNVCSNLHKAKLVCRRYCNLCNLTDGEWSGWTSWSDCSVSCDDGLQYRNRTCTNPAPANNGLDCVGSSKASKACHIDLPCPVQGGWTAWLPWSSCDASCGIGLHNRVRTCTNPVPAEGGDYCHGDENDYSLCTNSSCELDGSWSAWESWGSCSGQCGPGLRVKTRTCTNPAPVGHGTACTGDAHQYGICFDNCTTPTQQPPTTIMATHAPGECYDKLDNCYLYPRETACTEASYRPWALDKCPAYCGFCVQVTLTPRPCVDNVSNCAEYDAGGLCADSGFNHWVELNCYKYCNLGSCQVIGSANVTTVTSMPQSNVTQPAGATTTTV